MNNHVANTKYYVHANDIILLLEKVTDIIDEYRRNIQPIASQIMQAYSQTKLSQSANSFVNALQIRFNSLLKIQQEELLVMKNELDASSQRTIDFLSKRYVDCMLYFIYCYYISI